MVDYMVGGLDGLGLLECSSERVIEPTLNEMVNVEAIGLKPLLGTKEHLVEKNTQWGRRS